MSHRPITRIASGPVFWGALISLCWLTPTAWAEERTVYLRGGGFLHGDVMEATPGEFARVRLADGSVREVPWAEIERIDAPVPSAEPTPLTFGAPVVPSADGHSPQLVPSADGRTPQLVPLPPAPAARPSPAHAAEIAALEEQRRQIGLAMPITQLAVGAGAAGVLAYVGVVVLLMDSVCSGASFSGGGSSDCGRSDWVLPALFGGAGVAAVVAIFGGIELGDRVRERRAIRARIKELTDQQTTAAFDVRVLPNGGSLSLTVRF